MIDNEYLPYVTAFQAEHRELKQLVETVRQALGKARPWSPGTANEAAEALATLATYLRHHFAQEEAGGYLEQSLAAAPRFSHEAAVLWSQHALLLLRANEAMRSARQANDAKAWEKLKSDVRSLIAALLAHETAENRIVQQAFNSGEEQ